MRILFDQGTPVPLRHALNKHDVVTAFECGWQTLQNGDLLSRAEAGGFAAMITTDKNILHQQNFAGRLIAILVLSTTDWRRIRRHTDRVVKAVDALAQGGYVEVAIP